MYAVPAISCKVIDPSKAYPDMHALSSLDPAWKVWMHYPDKMLCMEDSAGPISSVDLPLDDCTLVLREWAPDYFHMRRELMVRVNEHRGILPLADCTAKY